MFGRLLGELISAPFKLAQVPTKILKAVDEATLDTGAAEALDDVVDDTIGEAGRNIRDNLADLDD